MGSMVETLYDELERACEKYLPIAARERINDAYIYARDAHGEQTRKSGEPYITHPITVALYLARLFVDESVIIGALLHDVAEDTDRTLEEIEAEFGTSIREIVSGVTHLANVSQLEDIAHLILAMSSDVRVVLVKLYDRLHNLRTLHYLPIERRRRKALETQRIYVPLAAKLGMWHLKTEFETLILYNIDEDIYHLICDGIDDRYAQHAPKLQEIATQMQQLLRRKNIPGSVNIRRRSPYRIYENMVGEKLDDEAFSKVFQIIILVDSLPACYLALGHIHDAYPHVAGSLRDSIGNPKDIFYRALHTDIIAPDYPYPVHLRIRTYEFDRLSEIGILAEIQFASAGQEKQPENAPWLPKLPELYQEVEDANRFVESVFQDILQKHLICFTPRGKEISLPRGATVIDFAYHLHTDIGHECRAAVVNNKQVDLNYQLKDGDQVYIIRSKQVSPQHEWMDEQLGYATTSRAKRKIREWFRHQPPERLVIQGRKTLKNERQRFNAREVTIKELLAYFNMDALDVLYRNLGNGNISVTDLDRALIQLTPFSLRDSERSYVEVIDRKDQTGWVNPIGTRAVRLANCCQPAVGDDILGLVNETRNVAMIHLSSCRHVMHSKRTERIVRMKWLNSIAPLKQGFIRIEAYDRGGLIHDITIPIAEVGGNIVQSDSIIHDKFITIRLKLELDSTDHFILIVHKLASLQNIRTVQRMSQSEVEEWQVRRHEFASD